MEFEKSHTEPKTLVEKIQYYGAGLLLLAIVGVMLYTVTMRYVFSRAPLWGEDVPRVFFVWLTLMFAGIAIKLDLNIRVTYFIDMMPARTRRAIEIAMHLIVLVMLAVFIWFSFPIIRLGLTGRMLSTGWTEAVFSLPLPLGGAVIFYYQALRLRDVLRRA